MKIIGIGGSPRDKRTNYMLRKVLEASGKEYELILLKDKKINSCLACKKCKGTFNCVQNDDMKEIRDKIKVADILVLGSPTYFSCVSGLMKNFMDRCLPFYFSQELKGKKAMLLTVGGFKSDLEFDENGKCKWHDEEIESVTRCLDSMRYFCEILGMKVVGKKYAIHGAPEEKETELISLGKKLTNL